MVPFTGSPFGVLRDGLLARAAFIAGSFWGIRLALHGFLWAGAHQRVHRFITFTKYRLTKKKSDELKKRNTSCYRVEIRAAGTAPEVSSGRHVNGEDIFSAVLGCPRFPAGEASFQAPFSWLRSHCFRHRPLAKPTRSPVLPMTRWQGTTMGILFLPLALPTARTLLMFPKALAISL